MIRADLCATRVKMAINRNGKQKLREKVLLFNRADKKKVAYSILRKELSCLYET